MAKYIGSVQGQNTRASVETETVVGGDFVRITLEGRVSSLQMKRRECEALIAQLQTALKTCS